MPRGPFYTPTVTPLLWPAGAYGLTSRHGHGRKGAHMRGTFEQALRLGFIILGLGVVIYGVDALVFAPRRIPPCVQEQLPPGRVCLDTILQRYGDKVVWIDARSEADFELNHLMLNENRMFPIRKGAALQEQVDAAMERMLAAAELGECIVVFCTVDCGSSEEIAQHLRSLGIIEAPVYVLEGGWDVLRRDTNMTGK